MLKTTEVISEPVRRTIFVGNRSYFLSFPKMRFNIEYCQIKVNCSFTRLMLRICIDEKYYNIPILPNMIFNGVVCLPFVERTFQSVEELQSYIINLFWSSRFADANDPDLDSLFIFMRRISPNINCSARHLCEKQFNEYFELWEKKTKEDPKWVPGLDFFKVKQC